MFGTHAHKKVPRNNTFPVTFFQPYYSLFIPSIKG